MTRYEEEYGEVSMTSQEELILAQDEQIENLKKCIESIKDTLKLIDTAEDDLNEIINEVKECIEELENVQN